MIAYEEKEKEKELGWVGGSLCSFNFEVPFKILSLALEFELLPFLLKYRIPYVYVHVVSICITKEKDQT